MNLTDKDKKVIRTFIQARSSGGVFSSNHLSTDGLRLDINGLGGHGVAEWRGGKAGGGGAGKIVLRPPGGLFEQKVYRFIRRSVGTAWLADRDMSRQRRDPAKPKKERYRMPYRQKTSFHRLGEGIIGRTTGSELHMASAESWRESASRVDDPKRKREFLSHARAHEKRAGSKGMLQSHRRVLEGELWKVWPKEFKYPASARTSSRRSIRMKTREGYENRELQDLTDEEIMHLLHPARRDPAVRRDYRPASGGASPRRRIPSKSETSAKALKHLPKGSLLHAFNKKVASSSRRGARRDASPRPSVLITRKKYKSKNGVKVKKTKYRIKSRDPAVRRDFTKTRSKGGSAWKVGVKEGRLIEENAFSIYGDAVKFTTAARARGDSVIYGPLRMSEGEVAGVPGWSRARGIRGLHASQTVSIGNKYP
jgi:hypothetical protein